MALIEKSACPLCGHKVFPKTTIICPECGAIIGFSYEDRVALFDDGAFGPYDDEERERWLALLGPAIDEVFHMPPAFVCIRVRGTRRNGGPQAAFVAPDGASLLRKALSGFPKGKLRLAFAMPDRLELLMGEGAPSERECIFVRGLSAAAARTLSGASPGALAEPFDAADVDAAIDIYARVGQVVFPDLELADEGACALVASGTSPGLIDTVAGEGGDPLSVTRGKVTAAKVLGVQHDEVKAVTLAKTYESRAAGREASEAALKGAVTAGKGALSLSLSLAWTLAKAFGWFVAIVTLMFYAPAGGVLMAIMGVISSIGRRD